jgi:hypothetical protein
MMYLQLVIVILMEDLLDIILFRYQHRMPRKEYRLALSLLLLLPFLVRAVHHQPAGAVPAAACSVVGCRICFDPEVCLLCDTNSNFQPDPVANACLCMDSYWQITNKCMQCEEIISNCATCA